MTLAAAKSVDSSKKFPTIWQPRGRPDEVKPDGRERAGTPARFAVTVKMSERYIARGSSVFSPRRKAGPGTVGTARTSHDANARSKSRRINARTFCALR